MVYIVWAAAAKVRPRDRVASYSPILCRAVGHPFTAIEATVLLGGPNDRATSVC